MEIKNTLDHESFYQSNKEKILHLDHQDCKNELQRLQITTNKGTNCKLINSQVLSDSVHQAELEIYQGHFKIDDNYPYHGSDGPLTYDLQNKNWITHIGFNNPSKCKNYSKNQGY